MVNWSELGFRFLDVEEERQTGRFEIWGKFDLGFRMISVEEVEDRSFRRRGF